MKLNWLGRCGLLLMMVTGCAPSTSTTEKLVDIEGLVEDQVELLSQGSRVLDKIADMNGEKSDSTFMPSKAGWASELEIFRELDLINKPANRDDYMIQDPLDDPHSNLHIRQISSNKAKVQFLKIYYRDSLNHLKRLEASLAEKNLLFGTRRNLSLEFDEEDGRPVLIRYSVSGYQKMILSDTVWFSMNGHIDW